MKFTFMGFVHFLIVRVCMSVNAILDLVRGEAFKEASPLSLDLVFISYQNVLRNKVLSLCGPSYQPICFISCYIG